VVNAGIVGCSPHILRHNRLGTMDTGWTPLEGAQADPLDAAAGPAEMNRFDHVQREDHDPTKSWQPSMLQIWLLLVLLCVWFWIGVGEAVSWLWRVLL